MKAAYDAAMAASLIASQIARHPLVETLSSEAQEKLQASGELAAKLNKGFAEMYGRPQ
ncbi:hypothetical protein RZS28_00605 [Methylocapsa polymorpha]|uniref:Uncharacterized protein n=1 Tax=Methylocapsa polymorpha TaxID=3080828 RepID=A0ABZ0HU34_9HYPH|nr:hypothetical protein RZS28_00605 [Methylocapsa sp. RX1]